MAYQPVQRNAGEIMYQAAMNRARTLGGAFDQAVNTMYERQEENKAFTSKLKALEAMLQTHSTKFGMDPDQLKQFMAVNPSESPKERYLRLGGFFEGTIKAAELQKMQLANQKAQQEMDQLKKLGDIYASFGNGSPAAPAAAGAPAPTPGGMPAAGAPPAAPSAGSRYRRVDGAPAPAPQTAPGEMSLLNSVRRFSEPQDMGQGMVGSQPFKLPTQMALPSAPAMQPPPAAPIPAPTAPAPQAAPAPAAEAAAPAEGIPAPRVPSWYQSLQTPIEAAAAKAEGIGQMDLSPEAQALARRIREQYEASSLLEEGKAPSQSISAAQERSRARKTITLDAEGIKAILSNPRILVESFKDVAGDAYQQGLRREALDRIMREQEQLRELQRQMRSRRAR